MSEVGLSVVVVTYNRATGLEDTLASILSQTLQPDELIISDDASTDETIRVVNEFEPKFLGRIIYSKNPENLGMPGNLNKALSLASERLIFNLHDGDVYSPELFERGVNLMKRYPTAGLAFWDDKDAWGGLLGVSELTNGAEFFRRYYLPRSNSIIWGTALVRAEVYKQCLPFNPSFKAWADVDMWMRICQNYDIAYIAGGPFVQLLDEGPFRAWNWEKALTIHRIFLTNITRMFCGEECRLRKEIKVRESMGRVAWCRHMLGRLRRREWRLFCRGLCYFPAFFSVSPHGLRDHLDSQEPSL